MFGWFRPRCPLDVREKTWVELRMDWLIQRFGKSSIQSLEVITPCERFFPDPWSGEDNEVRHLFGRVCDWIGVPRNRVELKIFDEYIPSSYIAYSHVSPLGVYTPGETASDPQIVWIQRSQLTDPLQFISTAAHELAHCILLGDEWLTDSVGDHEFITDLLPVVRGLGIFVANSATFEKTDGYDRFSFRSVSKHGYLPARMFGYGMAVLAWMRNEEKPDWGQYLCRDARSFFQDGLRYLRRTNDCRCPGLDGALTNHSAGARRGIESKVPGEFLSALWEFRKPGCPAPNHAEWASLVAGLDHRDPIVVAETALAIAALKRADTTVVERCLWHLRGDPDTSELRTALAVALGVQTPTPAIVDELTRMLEDPSVRVINGALHALRQLRPIDDPVVVPAVLRVLRKGMIDRQEHLMLFASEALRALSKSPWKLVTSHFAKDRELQRLAFGALQIEARDVQLLTPLLPNPESLPVPLPGWSPEPYHADFLDEGGHAGADKA